MFKYFTLTQINYSNINYQIPKHNQTATIIRLLSLDCNGEQLRKYVDLNHIVLVYCFYGTRLSNVTCSCYQGYFDSLFCGKQIRKEMT